MKATIIRKFRHRLSTLSVALLTMAWSGGLPGTAHAEFPPSIDMSTIGTPSGVAVDKSGDVYVSVRTAGQGHIWKYSPDGVPSIFANVGQAVIYGLAIKANGDVYAAMATGPGQGVYRVDRYGHSVRLPGTEEMVLPNGLAFDNRGNLYVTESYSILDGAYGQGRVWRIPAGGDPEVWAHDDLLTGTGRAGFPFPVGANGIAFYHGDLFVTNTDKGLIVRIPVAEDGSAGQPALWKALDEVPESLPALRSRFPSPVMPDGLALDVHGNLYLTILTRNAIVRIRAEDKVQESIAVLGAPPDTVPSVRLDMPASLAFGTGAGEQQNLFVTNLGMMTGFRALVKVPAGAPGRPLH